MQKAQVFQDATQAVIVLAIHSAIQAEWLLQVITAQGLSHCLSIPLTVLKSFTNTQHKFHLPFGLLGTSQSIQKIMQ